MLSSRIPSLDGLRAISIVLVLVGHLRNTLPASWLDAPVLAPIWLVFANQSLGVSVFFVISGFLITSLLVEEHQSTGGIRLGRFYLRRAFRILPAYYAFLVCMSIASQLGAVDLPNVDLASAALFVWNYVPETSSWWVGHSWSLSVEEQFYLFWPLVMALAGLRRARYLALGLILAAPALRVITYFGVPAFRDRLSIMLHTRVDSLMWGCLLALVWRDARFECVIRAVRGSGYRIAAFFLLVASPLLIAQFGPRYLMTVGYSLEGAAIAIMIATLVRSPQSFAARVLNLAPVAYFGRISYSLYLWQQPFLSKSPVAALGQFPLNLAVLFAFANFSFYFIERPFLLLRDRVLGAKSKRAIA